MVRKLAAILLLIGILTPYSCDVRPVSTLWSDRIVILLVGVPVLCIVLYVLQALLGAVRAALRRAPAAVNPALLSIFLLLVIGWVANTFREETTSWQDWTALACAVLWGGALVVSSLRRGPPAERFPLLLLANMGIPVVIYFYWEYSHLRYGAWILTAGYALAAFAELRGAGPPLRRRDAAG